MAEMENATMASHNAVLGLVSNAVKAAGVVSELQLHGFSTDDISALSPDPRIVLQGRSHAGEATHEHHVERGRILLSIHVEDAAQRALAKKVLQRHGALDVLATDEAGFPFLSSGPCQA
jgi:hypothetical protein